MFIEQIEGKLYELLYVECSRSICNESKKHDDEIKLWREMNDGMDFVYKSCKPETNKFGIFGIQVAGKMMHLNILIKDADNIHRLYHLYSTKIPIRSSDLNDVFNFVKLLLLLRNNMIVNISLLMHAPSVRSDRSLKRQKGTTISSN